jgi:hypothetical protein
VNESRIETALDDALASFRTAPGRPETGLDVSDPALLQLRKACRLVDAVEALRR